MPKAAKKPIPGAKAVDWPAIEAAYRNDPRPLRAIASDFAISAGRVCQVAKERGWTRHTPPFLNAATAGEAGNTIASGSGALPSNGNGFQSVASETGLPTTELNRQPTDDEDRDVRITLPRRVAATMSISMREAVLQVPLAEADAHPDFRDRIAELKGRRREANLRATQAVEENVAANEAAKRAEAHLDGLTAERATLDAQFPTLAVAFAKGGVDALALDAHQGSVGSLDAQIHALKIALPTLQDEARHTLQRNELFARAPGDIAVELNNLRAEAAAEIARSRW